MKSLLYMRMLLQVHPSLRAVIRTKLDGGTSAYGYNLMLVSEEYRLEGAVSVNTENPKSNADRVCRIAMLISKPRWPWSSGRGGAPICRYS